MPYGGSVTIKMGLRSPSSRETSSARRESPQSTRFCFAVFTGGLGCASECLSMHLGQVYVCRPGCSSEAENQPKLHPSLDKQGLMRHGCWFHPSAQG